MVEIGREGTSMCMRKFMCDEGFPLNSILLAANSALSPLNEVGPGTMQEQTLKLDSC